MAFYYNNYYNNNYYYYNYYCNASISFHIPLFEANVYASVLLNIVSTLTAVTPLHSGHFSLFQSRKYLIIE